MTSPLSTRLLNTWSKGIFLLLVSCASSPETERPADLMAQKLEAQAESQAANASTFEWAVQHYEAGAYDEAIAELLSLQKEGTSLAHYDLLSYYLGMSYFHTQDYPKAGPQLEAFLQAAGVRTEAQEARMALLLVYEQGKAWDKALALAAETEKRPLFQPQRALLKLVWALALTEKGEALGAKAILKDALQFLDRGAALGTTRNGENDLWGRYHFTALYLREQGCAPVLPKEIKTGKHTKRMYSNWLLAKTDCLKVSLKEAQEELFLRQSPWSERAGESLSRTLAALGKQIQEFRRLERGALNNRLKLEKESRESLYRLLSEVDKYLNALENQKLTMAPLVALRKQIDLLLVSISLPS